MKCVPLTIVIYHAIIDTIITNTTGSQQARKMAGEKICVLYFAGVKDVTNKESEEIALPQTENWTLADLTQLLIKDYGLKMNALLDISMYAMDMEYVEKDQESVTVLKPGSEIAIIPPVSGG